MKRDKTYKRIRKAMCKKLKVLNHQFDTDEWLEPGRYAARLVSYKCQSSIDISYPDTNKGIPFKFFEALGLVELIDRVNPINNVIVRIEGYGNDTKLPDDDPDIEYPHVNFDSWAINSWLQYCENGHVSDSPSHIDTNWYKNNPTCDKPSQGELKYLADVLKEYINYPSTDEYSVGGVDKYWKEQFSQGYYFDKKYLVKDAEGDLLYGIVGDRHRIRVLCRDKSINEYYLLIRDPRRVNSKRKPIVNKHSAYNLMKSVYFKNKKELFKFIDLISEDERSQLELLLALKGIYRDV